MTARGDRTKQHLLDVSERLFAERGIDAVSLREIRLAAGARNTGAMQFHFGDRHGLIHALAERHMPRIGALQQQLYERMKAERTDPDDLRSLVAVLVRPSAEYLTLGESERAWVKIMAALSSEPKLRATEMRSYAPAPALEVATELFQRMSAEMPRTIAAERMILLAQNAVQMCADRARIEESKELARGHIAITIFVENLVDMTLGALFAPVSDTTTALLVADATRTGKRKPAASSSTPVVA